MGVGLAGEDGLIMVIHGAFAYKNAMLWVVSCSFG